MNKNEEYKSQFKISILNLFGEMPNFFALLFSAISTRAVLVFVDLIDTGSNVLRNLLVVFISRKLRKDLRFEYNYGIGKIEALSSLICDFILTLSLTVMLGFAVMDLINPRPVGDFLLFVVLVKIVNICGDLLIFVKQKRLCSVSDSLVMKSSYSVALKNLTFDMTSFSALVLMAIFGDRKLFWYLSPVVSVLLGGYLLANTIMRLSETINVMLDKSADVGVQRAIFDTLQDLSTQYHGITGVQTRVSGGIIIVDLNLSFRPETTYEEMKKLVDHFSGELSKRVPNCEVTLRIGGDKITES